MVGFLHKIRKYKFQYLEAYKGDGDLLLYKESHGKDKMSQAQVTPSEIPVEHNWKFLYNQNNQLLE